MLRPVNKKLIVSSSIGAFISVAAFYFAFRNVPMVDLFRYMRTIEPVWIVPSVALCIIALYFRVQRWRLILGEKYHLPFWEAYHPMMIGFMANCILPGRVGEIARPAILKKRDNVPFSTGLATVAAERLFDLIFLLIFLAVTVTMVEIDDSLNIPFGDFVLNKDTLDTVSGGMLRLLVVLLAGAASLAFSPSRNIIKKMVSGMPGLLFFLSQETQEKIGQKICSPVNSLLDNFSFGFSQIREPKRLLGCLFLSAAVWVISALSYYVMTFGSPGIDMTFQEIFAMMIIICFVIALPSVPGFWGIWEAGGLFALTIFGVSGEAAAGFTLINHAVQIIPIILLGFISAFATGVNILSLQKKTHN